MTSPDDAATGNLEVPGENSKQGKSLAETVVGRNPGMERGTREQTDTLNVLGVSWGTEEKAGRKPGAEAAGRAARLRGLHLRG